MRGGVTIFAIIDSLSCPVVERKTDIVSEA
jgi:hypothetical protein